MDTRNPKGYKLSAWLDRETAAKLKIYAALRDLTLSDATKELVSRELKGIKITKKGEHVEVGNTITIQDDIASIETAARKEHDAGKTKVISSPKELDADLKELEK